MSLSPPDLTGCWDGLWRAPEPADTIWALSAMTRTVGALPRLHPWRLGDTKGSARSLVWVGASVANDGLAVLTQTAPEPSLPLGDGDPALDLTLPGPGAEAVTRWVGGMCRLPGSWLPPLAILPRALRGFDDPGTRWSTESIDFATRHTVHADDTRFAADVLAPHVMALILDVVPANCAVTVAGDAIHAWLTYDTRAEQRDGLADQLVSAVRRLRDAIPGFVLVDYPDRSGEVEADLHARSDEADSYRRQRTLGRSPDPTLQRIYEQSRAAWEAGHVSSPG